ncbi:MAG: extracellular solute-binding protein [Pseudomonadales bacterium]
MQAAWRAATLCAALLAVAACGGPGAGENPAAAARADEKLVVYSSRNEQLLAPVLARYLEVSGVHVQYATDDAGVLIERIRAEGSNSPADLLITVDAGTLGYAASLDLFQPLGSQVVRANIPSHLRDPDGLWAGLSLRARTIVHSTERVAPGELSTYSALADARWRGRLCLRTSKKVYNQSLVAMLISQIGEAATEKVVSGWVANLALPPASNDTMLMEAIIGGQCDVGIVNSYYFGRLQQSNPSLPLALFWPDQQAGEGGVHVNVAGAGILRHAPHPVAARKFLEWLTGNDAQVIFAGVNQEYPVNPATAVDATVATWGKFRASELPLAEAWRLQPAAVKLMDRAGYR